MDDKIIKAKYGSDKTALKLGNLEIPCYVLEDGTRVFSGRGIQKILGSESPSGAWLKRFIEKSDVSPRFRAGENSVLERINTPIKFSRNNTGGSQSATYGYEATLLIDICSAIIDANRAGEFMDEKISMNADVIIRSVAKVGIIALVDEVTGYQKDKDRAKDELQKFLNQFIQEEAAKWVKTFEDSFFEMIYKMRGWNWTYTNKKPGVVGIWINDIVYERLGPLVLSELQKKNPKTESGNRKDKHHQFLTPEMGIPKLKEHLISVQALGKASNYNWAVFMRLLDTAFPKQHQQLELVFSEEEDLEN